MKDRLQPTHNSKESLDRNQLQKVRENYLALNAYRLQFAREIFPAALYRPATRLIAL